MHDASKVLLGSHGSSDFNATNEPSDPATFPAGLAVRRKTDGTLSVASGDGQLIGVSMGESLSDTKKTSVCREGNRIPIQLEGFSFLTVEDLSFFSKVSAPVSIELLDTETQGSEEATVTGDAEEGYVVSVGIEGGVSTATQVAAAINASAEVLAVMGVIITGTAGDAVAAFAEDLIDGGFAVIGAAVKVSNSTGKAVQTGGTTTGASYVSGALSGVKLDGSEIPVALIDMGGGL